LDSFSALRVITQPFALFTATSFGHMGFANSFPVLRIKSKISVLQTFQYITAPTAVEKARRLGITFDESLVTASPGGAIFRNSLLETTRHVPQCGFI